MDSLPAAVWLLIVLAAILACLFTMALYFLPRILLGKPQPTLWRAARTAFNGIAIAILIYFAVFLASALMRFDLDAILQSYFTWMIAACVVVGMAMSIRSNLYAEPTLIEARGAVTLAVLSSVAAFLALHGAGKATGYLASTRLDVDSAEAYFTTENFRNPVLMQALFQQKAREDEFAGRDVEFVRNARLANALYVMYGVDYLKELCAWEPEGVAYVVHGALAIGQGVLITAATIDAISKAAAADGEMTATSDALVGWMQGIDSFDQIRRYARSDIDRVMADANGSGNGQQCRNDFTRRMTDGLNWYLVSVAPLIIG